MTIINPNSISGISSITALNSTAAINLFKADGTSANVIAGVVTATTFKGALEVTSASFSSNIDANGDLDVDGHTNLDNVSIAGVTTFSVSPVVPNGGYYKGIINSGSQQKIVGGYISGTDTLRLGESMYLTSTGLGINESSPSQRLHVGGDVQIGFNTPNDAGRQINFNVNRSSAGDTLANINWQWNNKYVAQIRGIAGYDTTNKDDAHLVFYTSSANNLTARLRIHPDGGVTIGDHAPTTTKAGVLHTRVSTTTRPVVFENDTENCDVVIKTTGTNKHSILGFGDGANNFIGNIDYDHQNNNMVFDTNGGERLRITSAGKIGIGEDAPTNMLHVKAGDTGVSSFDARYHITVENNGEAYLGFYVPNNSFAGVRFNDTTGLEGYLDYYFNTDEMVYYSSGIHKWSTSGTERLRIGSSGGVGISTDKIRNSDFLHIATASQDFTNPTEDLMDGGGICFQNTDTLATTGKTLPGIFWATNTNQLGRARAGIIGVSANNHDAADIVFLAKYLPGGEGIYPRNERMRITNGGQVRIGNPNNLSLWGQNNRLQVAGTDWNTSGVTIACMGNSGSANLVLGNSRASTPGGSGSALVQDSRLGYISFVGDDGTDMATVGAAIVAELDSNASSNSMPGRLRFYTGGNSNERLRITSTGEVNVGGTYAGTTHKLQVDNGTTHFKGRVFIRGTMSFNSTPFGANVTYDTGISVNAGGYGGSILAICSRNFGAGTNTQSGVYLIKFHYDGNNTPSITLIAGTNLATFGQSGSNTLTVVMGASNNMFTAIESSVVPTT